MWPEEGTLGGTATRHAISVTNVKSVSRSVLTRVWIRRYPDLPADCATDSLKLLSHCVLLATLFRAVLLWIALSLLLSCAFLPQKYIYKHSWEEAC